MSEELKPCPFCENPAVEVQYNGPNEAQIKEALSVGHDWDVSYFVACWCGCTGPERAEEDAAIRGWNTRSNTLIEEQAARIEELEQKLRTTSLEALAISDSNNEMAIRVAQLEKERDHWQSLHDARTKMLGDCADERDASQARSQAYEECAKIADKQAETEELYMQGTDKEREEYKFAAKMFRFIAKSIRQHSQKGEGNGTL